MLLSEKIENLMTLHPSCIFGTPPCNAAALGRDINPCPPELRSEHVARLSQGNVSIINTCHLHKETLKVGMCYAMFPLPNAMSFSKVPGR